VCFLLNGSNERYTGVRAPSYGESVRGMCVCVLIVLDHVYVYVSSKLMMYVCMYVCKGMSKLGLAMLTRILARDLSLLDKGILMNAWYINCFLILI